MKIQSSRFGSIEVADENIFEFSSGLPGFPEEKSFAFLPYQPDSPFAFLQSLRDVDLTFLVTDPFPFFSDYEFKLEDEVVEELNLAENKLPQIINMVTIPEKLEDMTANLLAPIVINRRTRQGKQVILEKTSYGTKHKVFPNGLPQSQVQGGK